MNRTSATTSPFATHRTRPLADHVHGFYSFESSPSTSKGAVAFCQPGPLFDGSMILLNSIIEILALAQTNSAGERNFGFQYLHCSRISQVLIPVDCPLKGIGGWTKYFFKER